MKQRAVWLILVGLASFVLAQDPDVAPTYDWRGLLTPEVYVALFGLFSGQATMALTELLKHLFHTEGRASEVANLVVNAGVNAAIGFLTGIYPLTWDALLYVSLSAVIGFVVDKKNYQLRKRLALEAAYTGLVKGRQTPGDAGTQGKAA